MAYVNYGEFAPAVPTSGRRIKELNTKYLLLMLFILILSTISEKKFQSEPDSVSLSSAIGLPCDIKCIEAVNHVLRKWNIFHSTNKLGS